MAELVVGTSPRAVRLLEPTLPRESPRVTPLQNEGRERGFRKRPPRGEAHRPEALSAQGWSSRLCVRGQAGTRDSARAEKPRFARPHEHRDTVPLG